MSKAQAIAGNEVLFKQLEQLMWRAGDAIMEIYHSDDFGEQTKSDNSPVTKADLAAHNVLVEALARLTPEIPIVSEEDSASLPIPQSHSIFWLIDPLDGTKEFIKRNDEFTCNLALIENGEATLGFVGIPAQSQLFAGGPRISAYQITKDGSRLPLSAKRSNDEVTRVVASKSHLNEATEQFIAQINGSVELVQAGSSLKFLKIATGEADIYPRLAPTCEWDTAAAHAVLSGAGGKVVQTNGEPLRYGKAEILNPHFIASGHSVDA